MTSSDPVKSLNGHLLIASAGLVDPNFAKSVVLLVQHDQQGALGLVLTRATSKTVKELWHEVGEVQCESEGRVHLGGPVGGPVMAVHADTELAEIEIVPGVFFAARKPLLDRLVRQSQHDYKIFVGHAGWAPGQLEHEIEAGGWLLLPAEEQYIFYQGTDLWEAAMRKVQCSSLPAMLNIKHVPTDPSVN